MKSKSICIAIFMFCFAFCNAQSNKIYQDALLKLYPDATQADWEEKDNYHVAVFTHNGFEMKTWMNNQAQWVMSVSYIGTTDELPSDVYNAFTFTQYSQWNVENVYWATFPHMQEQFVIKVNQDNSTQTYDLFFAPNGNELQSLDVSYGYVGITPQLFGIGNG